MRDAWLPLGLLLVASVVPLAACGQAFELTGSTTTTGTGLGGASATSTSGDGTGGAQGSSGVGGDPTTASTTTSTSTGSGGKLCTTAAECGSNNTLCGDFVCASGHCALHQLQPDGTSFSQLYGDCHVAKCFKAKLLYDISDQDIYDDGNPCTQDTCVSGAPTSKVQTGSQCGANGVCNAKGVCVECISNGTCDGGKPTCVNNYCSGQNCQDQIPDGNETDVDCGGDQCGPCDPSKLCKLDTDCRSKVCGFLFMGAPAKQCLIASCTDGVQNGNETDIDCGGTGCPVGTKCADNKHCAVGLDCMSGVCQAGTCKPATCTDGVKNGAETGVDCGVAGCAFTKCPGG
ncbi:MAG: hypothetical protein ABJE95_04750 [Byssovorax sp.]